MTTITPTMTTANAPTPVARMHAAATETLLEARWRVGARRSLHVVVSRAVPQGDAARLREAYHEGFQEAFHESYHEPSRRSLQRDSGTNLADGSEVTVRATLEDCGNASSRGRSNGSTRGQCDRFDWRGALEVDAARDGSLELRLRLHPSGELGREDRAAGNAAARPGPEAPARTARLDCVFPQGAAPVLVTDLPEAIGLRGGTYALLALDAPLALGRPDR